MSGTLNPVLADNRRIGRRTKEARKDKKTALMESPNDVRYQVVPNFP
jgi:hypothetical protein